MIVTPLTHPMCMHTILVHWLGLIESPDDEVPDKCDQDNQGFHCNVLLFVIFLCLDTLDGEYSVLPWKADNGRIRRWLIDQGYGE